RKLDLRVSTLPTQYGEKVVMRLLEPEAPLLTFAHLGMAPEIENALREVLRLPQGMLLVTGPTGSGKSTTLYASLNLVRNPTVNIITLEDPVEYALEGINQVQLNPKADLTFASCLRSILRQDPNVIMVGEIRDFETAEIALKASQTGHLVLSTLHTNDSVAAVTRLLDLNIPAFLIASSVTAIIAQRLVRKLCVCRNRVPVTPLYRARLAELGLLDGVEAEYVPTGCAECQQTGHKGRVGIYEMLLFNEAIRPAVRSGLRADELRQLAGSRGMKLMQEDALEKVRRGVTSLDEALRVVPFERGAAGACPHCGRELGPGFLFCPYCSARTEPAHDAERVALTRDVEEGAVRE
ncbi:MAG TPA: ATPase, T2SS/T4P/T4SS family, partial [Candidatus Acidoferrales bacterium]|nr:ATPase, T2SS/T4P/T4SS family [Candidatus Acidoferrales bacterium]